MIPSASHWSRDCLPHWRPSRLCARRPGVVVPLDTGLRCNWAAGGLVGPWPCPQQKGQVQAGAERPHTLERLGELNLSHPGGLERDRDPSEEDPAPGPGPFSAPLRALSSWPSEGCRVSSSVVNVLFSLWDVPLQRCPVKGDTEAWCRL